MGRIDTFNRWLVGGPGGTTRVRIMCPPTPDDLLTEDEAMLLAAYLLVCSGCDRERFRVILDAVLDT